MKWLFEPHSPFPSEARQLALGSAAWLVQELVRFASKEPEVTSLLCDTTNIPDGMRLRSFRGRGCLGAYMYDSKLVTPLTPSLIINRLAKILPTPIPTPMVAPMPTPDITPILFNNVSRKSQKSHGLS